MKDKIKDFFLSLNALHVLVVAYSLKFLILSPTIFDCVFMAVVSSTYLCTRFLAAKEPVLRRPDKMKEDITKLNEDIKEIKSALTKVNLAKISETKRYF